MAKLWITKNYDTFFVKHTQSNPILFCCSKWRSTDGQIKMHIYMHICMHMGNKNVQVLSIHKKNCIGIQMRIQMCTFFPVYGRNLHIFITHVHTNVHINVHFYLTICGAPTTATARPSAESALHTATQTNIGCNSRV